MEEMVPREHPEQMEKMVPRDQPEQMEKMVQQDHPEQMEKMVPRDQPDHQVIKEIKVTQDVNQFLKILCIIYIKIIKQLGQLVLM